MLIAPKDHAMATNPLDALKARNMIADNQHAAAGHFRACRLRVFGSPHAKATNLLQASEGGEEYRHVAEAERAYRDACVRLLKHSAHHLAAIERLVVHEVWPDWVTQPGRKRGRAVCVEALDVLVKWHADLQRNTRAA